MVNETFAKKFFSGRNPIGHTVSFTDKKPFTIVGVANDSVYASLDEEKMAMAWFPYTQAGASGGMHFELRVQGPPLAILPQVRRVVADFAPDLALLQPRTQRAEFDEDAVTQRLLARLSITFAVLAAVLIAVGLYGTTSYQVERRTGEFGVRMALGAARGQLMWMILRGALRLAFLGLVLGLAITVASSKILATLLFGVQPTDAFSIGGAVVAILAITLAATLRPALRGASVDPVIALRQE